jgi:hypothetical protein
MPPRLRLPWPLPALLAWAAAWLAYAGLTPVLGPLRAWLLAGLRGVLASLAARPWWRRLAVTGGFPLSCLLLWGPSGLAAISPWLWLGALFLLLLVYPLNAWRDAPLFPTPRSALLRLPEVAALPPGARVLDAGCGLGDGLRALRAAYPAARIEGLEWSWPLRWACALRCPWARVRHGDIWRADWSGYQMVYLFQRPESMGRAAAKAAAELAEGCWLVSLDFALPGVPPDHHWRLDARHSVWVYRMPSGRYDDPRKRPGASPTARRTMALKALGLL